MRVLVLGAGVAGMATAYYLWQDGHEVTVVDRQPGPGRESSYGNAGGLCPSFAGPWAAPGMVGKVLRMALQRHAPIRFSLWPEPERLGWVRQWVANCRADRFQVNKARMQRVAHYSLRCLRALMDEAGLQQRFDFHHDGTLQLFETAQELAVAQLASRTLAQLGIPWHMLDATAARTLEPALAASQVGWTGALHLPADASGDSHLFCQALCAYLVEQGVRMRFNTPVRAVHQAGSKLAGVEVGGSDAATRETLQPDACVVALGSYAPALLRPLGLHLPVYPLKGYSITVPIVDACAAPRMAVMDEHNKIMISRLGDRLRVAGMAELVGHDLRRQPDRRDLLVRLTRRLFPEGLDFDGAEFWAGLRPMTPDGPPVLGRTRIDGLFLNAGHGSNGWTQSCGTARVVADLLAGRAPEIDTDGLTGERFGLVAA